MRNQIQYQPFIAALSLLLLSNCGGGFVGIDGSGSKPQLQVSATGPINGFGSVIVNGVHYNTDNALVYIRGNLAEEMALDVGDYVVVVGAINSDGEGIANEVHYQPRVTGLVETVDVNLNRLSVMGQNIQLMEDTTYSSDIAPRNIEGIKPGQKVTVSGISDAQNVIRATRIELSEYADFEVLGAIESVDSQKRVFYIDDLKVDYRNIPVTVEQMRDGKVVAVSGQDLQDGTLLASAINFNMDYRQLRSVDSIEFTGFVKNKTISGFDIDTLPVAVDANTVFQGGKKADLSNNDKVRIKGAITDQDVLLAELVEFLPSPDMKVYGTLQSVIPASWGSPFLGKVQVQDHIFWVKFDTRLDGDLEQRISFMDLRIGDSVYVSGYAKEGNLYATSIAVDNRQFEHFTYDIQGFAFAVVPEQHSFSIFNTRVVTNEETVFGDGYNSYTQDQFYNILTSQYVLVRGYFDFERYMMVATRVTFIFPWGPPPPPPPM